MSNNEEVGRLVYSGSSTLEGITTNKRIKTSGSSKLNGIIECYAFRSSGTLKGAGEISTEADFSSSGTFRLEGSITSGKDIKTSGSAYISGELIARNDFRSSGTLKVSGLITTGGKARFGGSTTCSSGVEINGELRTSGTFRSLNVNVKEGFWGSGRVVVSNEITSQKILDLEGEAIIGGSISAQDVLFDQRNRFRRLGYWTATIFQFIKRVKYAYRVKGNIYAKESLEIDRSMVGGDIKARNVKLGRFTKVEGTIYYAENCEIHKKAKLAHEPLKVKLEEL